MSTLDRDRLSDDSLRDLLPPILPSKESSELASELASKLPPLRIQLLDQPWSKGLAMSEKSIGPRRPYAAFSSAQDASIDGGTSLLSLRKD